MNLTQEEISKWQSRVLADLVKRTLRKMDERRPARANDLDAERRFAFDLVDGKQQ